MTVSESSMGVDEGEIIVNETQLIAFVPLPPCFG